MEKTNTKTQNPSAAIAAYLGHGQSVMWFIACAMVAVLLVISEAELEVSSTAALVLLLLTGLLGTLMSAGILLIMAGLIASEQIEAGQLQEAEILRKNETAVPLLKLNLLSLAKSLFKGRKPVHLLLYGPTMAVGLVLAAPGLILWDAVKRVLVKKDYAPGEQQLAQVQKLGYTGLIAGYFATAVFWIVTLNIGTI